MNQNWVLQYLKRLDEFFANDEEALLTLQILRKKAEKIGKSEGKSEKAENVPAFPKAGDLKSLAQFPLPLQILNQVDHYALYSDGACRGNPGPGAWASMAQSGDGQIIFELSGLEVQTTNNKMELEGAISALRELERWLEERGGKEKVGSSKVFLFSDSRYVIEGAQKWMKDWKRRGWKKSDNKAPENLDYWQEFDQLLQLFPHIQMIWVKGHSGHPQNEYCDQLANRALDEAGF